MAREGAAALQSARTRVALNVPPWLLQRWTQAYGADEARRIAAASLAEAPLDISVKDAPRGVGGAARRPCAADRIGAARRRRPHRGFARL